MRDGFNFWNLDCFASLHLIKLNIEQPGCNPLNTNHNRCRRSQRYYFRKLLKFAPHFIIFLQFRWWQRANLTWTDKVPLPESPMSLLFARQCSLKKNISHSCIVCHGNFWNSKWKGWTLKGDFVAKFKDTTTPAC